MQLRSLVENLGRMQTEYFQFLKSTNAGVVGAKMLNEEKFFVMKKEKFIFK